MTLSEQLRRRLLALSEEGVSLYHVAKLANVGNTTLYCFVHGDTKYLRPATFERVVEALGLGLCQIGEAPSPGKRPGRPHVNTGGRDGPPKTDTTRPTTPPTTTPERKV